MTPFRIFAACAVYIAVLLMCFSPCCAQDHGDEEQSDSNGTGGSIFDEDLADILEPYSLDIFMSPKVEDLFERGYVRNPLRFKLGLPIKWETDMTFHTLINNPYRQEHHAGVSEISFGAKYGWRKWLKKDISAATALSVDIPTGDHPGVSGEYTHVRPRVIFTRKFPVPAEKRKHKVSSSIGLDFVYGGPVDEKPNNTLRTAIGTTYPFGDYDAAVEAVWITDAIDEGSAHSYFLTPGIIYHVPREYYSRLPDEISITLRGGVRFGFGDAEEDVDYITRINIDIPLKIKLSMRGIEMEGIVDTQWPSPEEHQQAP